MAQSFRLGYRPALDGLRGLAVLSVMLYHTDPDTVLPGGFLGVDLFFVLSGFLITARIIENQQETGSVDLLRFYYRRVLRLLPALLLMLAACCLFAAFRTKPDRARVIYDAAILTAFNGANWDWLCSVRLDMLGHAWSLSLEEQFYLVWPICLWAFLKSGMKLRYVAWITAAGIVSSAILRAALWTEGSNVVQQAVLTNLLTRGDALLTGCLLALLAMQNIVPSIPVTRLLAVGSGIALSVVAFQWKSGHALLSLGGNTLIAFACAAIIAALIWRPEHMATRFLSWPRLVWIGRISYGLYLWHFPLLTIAPKMIHSMLPITRRLPCPDWVLSYAATFAIAAASYHWLERPLLRSCANNRAT